MKLRDQGHQPKHHCCCRLVTGKMYCLMIALVNTHSYRLSFPKTHSISNGNTQHHTMLYN